MAHRRAVQLCFIFLLFVLVGGCTPKRLPDARPLPSSPLLKWHKAYRFGQPWRLTVEGVEVKGEGRPRTEGRPLSATAIWEELHPSINRWAWRYKVPAEVIIATIALEGKRKEGGWGRDPRSTRQEKGYVSDQKTPHLTSIGLMQITISTARAVMAVDGWTPERIDRAWLYVPDNNIRAGTAYIALQARGQYSNVATLLDPPVVFAAYNAGGVYHARGRKNPWKMKQYPQRSGEHVDKGVAYLNDAIAVLAEHPLRPRYDWLDYLADLAAWRPE